MEATKNNFSSYPHRSGSYLFASGCHSLRDDRPERGLMYVVVKSRNSLVRFCHGHCCSRECCWTGVVPFSATGSIITSVVTFCCVATNVVCLVWFDRLRRKLRANFSASGRSEPLDYNNLPSRGHSRQSSTGSSISTTPTGPRKAVSMITFSSDGHGPGGEDIRITSVEETYRNQVSVT